MSATEILQNLDDLPTQRRVKALRQIVSNILDVTERDLVIEWMPVESIAEQAWRDYKAE